MVEVDILRYFASSTCDMPKSSLHFFMLLPGLSDKVISPAILSCKVSMNIPCTKRFIYHYSFLPSLPSVLVHPLFHIVFGIKEVNVLRIDYSLWLLLFL